MTHPIEHTLQPVLQQHQIPFAFLHLDPLKIVLVTNALSHQGEDRGQIFQWMLVALLKGFHQTAEIPGDIPPVIDAVVLVLTGQTVLLVRQMEQAEHWEERMTRHLYDKRTNYLDHLRGTYPGETNS